MSSARISIGAGSATVAFTVADGCDGVAVSLVSYTAPAPAFDPGSSQQQVLFRASSVTAPAGAQTLIVEVPACFFQADFVFGAPLQTLGPAGTGNFYGEQGRLILAWTGGNAPCATPTTTTSTTLTTVTTPSTAPPTTAPPTTATTPSTTPQTTTSSVPSTTSLPPGTTIAAAPPPTTPPTSTGITTAPTTTAGAVGPPPATTTTRRRGAPFTPPPQRPAQPKTARRPPLPFTGLPLTSFTGIGLALLIAGLLIRFFGRGRGGPLVLATPLVPADALQRTRASHRLDSEARRFDYRVVVPGFGSGASIDEAEQKLLDRRWARLGSPTLGAPGRRAPTP